MGYISTVKTGLERERAGPKDGAVASVTVSVDALGSVNVIGDSVPQGQGHQTALAQIVADRLGLTPDDVVVALDTDTAKDGWSIAAGNYSCRFAPASASAAHQAATRVREKMARIAAANLNVPVAEVEFTDGKIHAANNPDNAIPFYRIGGLAHWSPSSLPDDVEPGIRETAMWNAPELTPTTAKDEINTSLAYGFGFDFCGVEVDPATGVVTVDRYVSAHDCGTILNPGLAEGQIRGSWASAYGATFLEEFRYEEDGTFRSGTFAEYLVPTAAELPEIRLVHPTPHPSPYTRLGAKGIAEGNQYTTPVCVANAVADALGVEDIQLPLKPAKGAGVDRDGRAAAVGRGRAGRRYRRTRAPDHRRVRRNAGARAAGAGLGHAARSGADGPHRPRMRAAGSGRRKQFHRCGRARRRAGPGPVRGPDRPDRSRSAPARKAGRGGRRAAGFVARRGRLRTGRAGWRHAGALPLLR